MKNPSVKLAFLDNLKKLVKPSSFRDYKSHLNKINECLGQSDEYVYRLSSFHLDFLKLKLDINRKFLAKSKDTRRAYLVALNHLIKFVHDQETQQKSRVTFGRIVSEPYVIARAA